MRPQPSRRPPGESGSAAPPHAFPRAERYAALRGGVPGVRERRREAYPFPYSERHLQCVWFDPAYRPAALRTARGEPVAVADPGRWNLEAGPDFRDAVLVVGPARRMLRGDVEVHVNPADWRAHGHAADPRYAGVVAHVTYTPAAAGAAAAAGLPPAAVSIALREALRADPAFSFENVDVTAYPYGAAVDRPPCAAALAGWTTDERLALLECAGEERLRAKAARVGAAVAERGAEQALYEEIMAALGYKHNRVPFRRLARLVPVEGLRAEAAGDPLRAYALLLGAAALLPDGSAARRDAETAAFVRALWDRWWKMSSAWEHAAMGAAEWRLSGLRPANHPLRRLAAAAWLFAPARGLAPAFTPSGAADAAWLAEARARLLAADGPEYWRRRLSLGGKRLEEDVALLGEARAAAIVSNAIVPCAGAAGCDVAALLPRLPPEHDNSLCRETAHKLFGRDHNPALHRTGLRQQGLLQIFHDFCLANRSACRECPLPAALKTA